MDNNGAAPQMPKDPKNVLIRINEKPEITTELNLNFKSIPSNEYSPSFDMQTNSIENVKSCDRLHP